MSKFTIIEGGGPPPSDETKSTGAPSEGAIEGETEEAALRRALAAFDDSAYQAEPVQPGGSSTIARDFYRQIVRELRAVTDQADLRIPSEFHTLLWLATRLGGDQKFISGDQFVAPAAVSRWVCAGQTPGRHKRRGILASALRSLDRAVQARSVVPLITLAGRRTDPHPAEAADHPAR